MTPRVLGRPRRANLRSNPANWASGTTYTDGKALVPMQDGLGAWLRPLGPRMAGGLAIGPASTSLRRPARGDLAGSVKAGCSAGV